MMRIKTLSVLCLFILSFSCKKGQENDNLKDTIEENKGQEITEIDISKIKYIEYTLDKKTETAIEDWLEYIEFQDLISDVKKGDLSFFNDNRDEIKSLLKKLQQSPPEQVNTPAILARMLVLETKVYKLESLSNLSTTDKDELINTIKEFFIAFSNLNLQMNKKIEFDSRSIERP